MGFVKIVNHNEFNVAATALPGLPLIIHLKIP